MTFRLKKKPPLQSQDYEYLSREAVAEMLGLRVSTLASWACLKKHLPFYRVGRIVRYRKQDVLNFIAQGKVEIENHS